MKNFGRNNLKDIEVYIDCPMINIDSLIEEELGYLNFIDANRKFCMIYYFIDDMSHSLNDDQIYKSLRLLNAGHIREIARFKIPKNLKYLYFKSEILWSNGSNTATYCGIINQGRLIDLDFDVYDGNSKEVVNQFDYYNAKPAKYPKEFVKIGKKFILGSEYSVYWNSIGKEVYLTQGKKIYGVSLYLKVKEEKDVMESVDSLLNSLLYDKGFYLNQEKISKKNIINGIKSIKIYYKP